jgi:hypothetical protein
MILPMVTLAEATTMAGYGNSDRYRGGPIDGISTEAFHDGRKGYCRIDTANLRLRHEGELLTRIAATEGVSLCTRLKS